MKALNEELHYRYNYLERDDRDNRCYQDCSRELVILTQCIILPEEGPSRSIYTDLS
jgi:hypothetical protein